MNIVTCQFEKCGCRHSALFLTEYKRPKKASFDVKNLLRTNRNKKTKILRCFPHCCPEHLNRSYCGSSLCVRVKLANAEQFGTPQQTTPTVVESTDSASLLVYAHFEEAQARYLAVGDLIDCNNVQRSIQTEQTPKGSWIEGILELDEANDTDSVFRINPSARWYYEWESAATKAQRFTKHALRVYIFQRVESQLRVVCNISSPEFMVVSYRRATIEVHAEREALEAFRIEAIALQNIRSKADEQSNGNITASLRCKYPPLQVPDRREMVWQNRMLWEGKHSDIMTSSKQLAILYYFVQFLNASSYGVSLQQLSETCRAQVVDNVALSGNLWEKDIMGGIASLSWTFLEPRQGGKKELQRHRKNDEKADVDNENLRNLISICSGLAGWLTLDIANLTLYQRVFQSYSISLLEKSKVRAGYVEIIRLMCELIDCFVDWSEEQNGSSSASLPCLCEDIMAAVFQYSHLKPLRPVLMAVLLSNRMFGMHEFVAQLRAQYLIQQRYTVPRRCVEAWQNENQMSVFDGLWVFDGNKSQITPISKTRAAEYSLGSILAFLRELAQINICPLNSQSLEIRSNWNICSAQIEKRKSSTRSQSGLILVLDNRQRIYGNLPSGISSAISLGGHQYGDYCGKLISPNSFEVEMCSWPANCSRPCQALRWKLHVNKKTDRRGRQYEKSQSGISVNVVVEEGVWQTNTSNQVLDFHVLPFKSKIESVEAWYPIFEIVGLYNHIC
ncbi:hypothetical protein CCR75_002251 [Bremia lactucae]|uniref:Uncharacterized protein n=1 Tax=Bremia lactucae TaxID=4779 RepID=A0A976FMF6_BRELC|nr:hypothetical protein CCR75_002251 [Bremia lactucae]